HQVELPREVRGVADAGAHALARERRHLMSGIARDQQPSITPAIDPARLERVDGVALERRVRAIERPRREQAPGGRLVVEVLDLLAGKTHEFPPAAPGAAGDDGRRPRGMAEL